MEIILIKLLQFMLAISLLVLLHEGGHFFFSKLFGVRVEKFYLFFDPWFHLFEFKPRNSETTYGVGWLPLDMVYLCFLPLVPLFLQIPAMDERTACQMGYCFDK